MNELIKHKSWWQRNWKWLVPLTVLIAAIVVALSSSRIGEDTAQIAKAYTDVLLYENAFKLAKENEEVKELLGELKPMDKMTILEGSVKYSNEGNSVVTKVRVKGSEGKGMLDIFANKKGSDWKYEKISIRAREPKQTIINIL